MDKIIINDLRFRCIVGINPDERREKQDVVINVILWTDLHKAADSDAIEDTVNYREVKLKIRDLVEDSQFLLVEKLASEIARICLGPKAVSKVTVRLDKPGALRFARTVGVEIERTRADFDTFAAT